MELSDFYDLYGALNVVHARMPHLNLMDEWTHLLWEHGYTHADYIEYSRERNGVG